MKLYIITGPNEKTGIIARKLRVRPTDTAKDIERKAEAIKERLNREWGVRGIIGVCVDDDVKCEHRNLRQVRRKIRRYRRKWDYFSPVGETDNFITVVIDGKKVTVQENRWNYKRELRRHDRKERIQYLLHPHCEENRISFRIKLAIRYNRRLSRQYGLHISNSSNPQFPYYVRDYGECFNELEIQRAVWGEEFLELEKRRKAIDENDADSAEDLLGDAMYLVEKLDMARDERLESLLDRYENECLPCDSGRDNAVLAILDDTLNLLNKHFNWK